MGEKAQEVPVLSKLLASPIPFALAGSAMGAVTFIAQQRGIHSLVPLALAATIILGLMAVQRVVVK
jgi:hypothetical protein